MSVEPPRVSCPKCGVSRPSSLASTVPRPPCSVCGEQRLAIGVGIAEEIDTAESISVALRPGDQIQGWRRRWSDVKEWLPRLLVPREEELSGSAILAARAELLSFFVHGYHIKDALCAEANTLGLAPETIEEAITADPELALLADLANLDKHLRLDRPPRSGSVPVVEDASGVQAGSGEGGWMLELPIRHAGAVRDGLDVATAVTVAWESHLASWRLI
jgi:hypothetical protein